MKTVNRNRRKEPVMKKQTAYVLFFFALFSPLKIMAQTQPDTVPAAKSNFSINGLKFLAGTWEGNIFGGTGTEFWMEPTAGTMMGMFKLVVNDTTKLFEFFIVEQKQDQIILRFKHFLSEYTVWEKEVPLTFALKELSDSSAVFESDVQKSPKRMIFKVVAGDTLRVRVEGEGKDGKTDFFETVSKRIK